MNIFIIVLVFIWDVPSDIQNKFNNIHDKFDLIFFILLIAE